MCESPFLVPNIAMGRMAKSNQFTRTRSFRSACGMGALDSISGPNPFSMDPSWMRIYFWIYSAIDLIVPRFVFSKTSQY
jgi:hypothetical protein